MCSGQEISTSGFHRTLRPFARISLAAFSKYLPKTSWSPGVRAFRRLSHIPHVRIPDYIVVAHRCAGSWQAKG
jgi:hypothetical protein